MGVDAERQHKDEYTQIYREKWYRIKKCSNVLARIATDERRFQRGVQPLYVDEYAPFAELDNEQAACLVETILHQSYQNFQTSTRTRRQPQQQQGEQEQQTHQSVSSMEDVTSQLPCSDSPHLRDFELVSISII